MKKRISLNLVLNLLMLLMAGVLLINKVPLIVDQFQRQNQSTPEFSVTLLTGQLKKISSIKNNFFQENQDQKNQFQNLPVVLIFWATWCGPCEVELNRLNKMILENSVTSENIIAISSFEDKSIVQKAVEDRKYLFQVGIDSNGEIGRHFNVTGTPTIVLINREGKVDWITTGLSPLLEYRVQKLFASK